MSKSVMINETVYNTTLPLQSKDTVKGDIFITKGSTIGFYSMKTLRLFCAWKRKDNQRGNLDLDFGAILIYQKERITRLSNKNYTICNYIRQKPKFATHSGDFTSCREFNYENPVITAEFIDFNLDSLNDGDRRIMLYAAAFNSQSMSEYDIYFGAIEEDKINYDNKRTVNLNDASFVFKIESPFDACFLGKLTRYSIQIYCEPLNKSGGAHSDGHYVCALENMDEYYKHHKYINLGAFFENICKAKGYKLYKVLDIDCPKTIDLLITNEHTEYSSDSVKEVYRIYNHQDEIKKLLNSDKIF